MPSMMASASENLLKMNPVRKYVAKAEAGIGWRIWNRRTKRWWGNYFSEYPEAVLEELNGLGRQHVLVRLCRSSQSKEAASQRAEKRHNTW